MGVDKIAGRFGDFGPQRSSDQCKASRFRCVGNGRLGSVSRELTALFVEAGHDVRGIVEPAITASTAILGRR